MPLMDLMERDFTVEGLRTETGGKDIAVNGADGNEGPHQDAHGKEVPQLK